MSATHDRWLEAARQAALEAGGIISASLGRPERTRLKGPANLVTEVDTNCESIIRSRLLGEFPEHGFLGEEGGGSERSDALWVVDPLDGTSNFVHGYPRVAVSIALELRGTVEVGVVYDAIAQELFSAVRGQGAWLSGERLSVSATATLETALLSTGLSKAPQRQARLVAALAGRCHGLRASGSAALDFCAVAAGRTDAFWDWGLRPWDVAAGSLLVSEAGGTVTGTSGQRPDIRRAGFLCTNTRLHRQMVELLEG